MDGNSVYFLNNFPVNLKLLKRSSLLIKKVACEDQLGAQQLYFCRISVSIFFSGLHNTVKKTHFSLSKRSNQSNKSVVIRIQAVVHPVFLTPVIYQ